MCSLSNKMTRSTIQVENSLTKSASQWLLQLTIHKSYINYQIDNTCGQFGYICSPPKIIYLFYHFTFVRLFWDTLYLICQRLNPRMKFTIAIGEILLLQISPMVTRFHLRSEHISLLHSMIVGTKLFVFRCIFFIGKTCGKYTKKNFNFDLV